MARQPRFSSLLARALVALTLFALVACGSEAPATTSTALTSAAPAASAATSAVAASSAPSAAPTATVAPPTATPAPPTATAVPPTPTVPPATPTRVAPPAAKGPVPTVTTAANQPKLDILNAGPLEDAAGFTGVYYGGEIVNRSGNSVSFVKITVTFLDEGGKVISTSNSSNVGRNILLNEKKTIFLVSMSPKVDKWAGVKIETAATVPVTTAYLNQQFPSVEFDNLRAELVQERAGPTIYALGRFRNRSNEPSDNPFVMIAGYDANNTLTHIAFGGGLNLYVEPYTDVPFSMAMRGAREVPARLEAHLKVVDAAPGVKPLEMEIPQHTQLKEGTVTAFIGEVVNTSQVEAGYIQVTITPLDASGKIVGIANRASVATAILPPGAKTVWRTNAFNLVGEVARYEIKVSALPASDTDRERQYNDLQVEGVELKPGREAVQATGELVNTGAGAAGSLNIYVAAYDANGKLISVASASTGATTKIAAGERAKFTATLYGATEVPAKHDVYVRAWKST